MLINVTPLGNSVGEAVDRTARTAAANADQKAQSAIDSLATIDSTVSQTLLTEQEITADGTYNIHAGALALVLRDLYARGVGGSANVTFQVASNDGRHAWTVQVGGSTMSSTAVADGAVVAVHPDGNHCLQNVLNASAHDATTLQAIVTGLSGNAIYVGLQAVETAYAPPMVATETVFSEDFESPNPLANFTSTTNESTNRSLQVKAVDGRNRLGNIRNPDGDGNVGDGKVYAQLDLASPTNIVTVELVLRRQGATPGVTGGVVSFYTDNAALIGGMYLRYNSQPHLLDKDNNEYPSPGKNISANTDTPVQVTCDGKNLTLAIDEGNGFVEQLKQPHLATAPVSFIRIGDAEFGSVSTFANGNRWYDDIRVKA